MNALWWSSDESLIAVVGMTLLGMILAGAFIASSLRQHRRFLRARRSFAARLLTAQDEERAAIARELHDDVVQRLISLANDLRQGDHSRRGPVAPRLDKLADELRAKARGMHPSVVDHVALRSALEELAETVAEGEGIRIEVLGDEAVGSGDWPTDGLPIPVRLSLYRVAQEAISNAVRHAGVDLVQVRVDTRGEVLQLEIIDHGRGFNISRGGPSPGLGVSSMRERLEVLGGTLTIHTQPGRGTTVVAQLPRAGVLQ